MSRKIFFSCAQITLLIALSLFSFRIETVRAQTTIYIRADGSIDPPTAPISSVDNVTYTLTGNINGSVVVERNDTVVDGEGHIVQGTGSGTGIYLSDRSNVTVKNMEIRAFQRGIRLDDSSSNTISANNVTNNEYGIVLYHSSSGNTLRNNDASDNRYNLGVFTSSVSGFIQDIDDSNTVNGKPVYYWVNKRDMAVPLDAGYVVLVNCTRITVRGLCLANNMQGVALAFTTNSIITNNSIMNNFDGIRLDYSSNNNVMSGNNITASTSYGIRFFYDPSTNAMSRNDVVKTEYGSELDGPPNNNIICGNNITNNQDGIRLDYPSNNTISANNVANNAYGIELYGPSSGNTISGNNIIANKVFGIWFDHASNNQFYHNNFIGNTLSVYPEPSIDLWDAGYPSGGNYWSHYDVTDIYSGLCQNETGSDGIGDTPYRADNYPLMGMFRDFDIAQEYHVQTICNSTISDFQFNGTAVMFNVTGVEETTGFCRICIPTNLMNADCRVFVNGTEVISNLLPCSNSTHSYLYFNYTHSTQEVIIVTEFPSFFILPLSIITTLMVAITYFGGKRLPSIQKRNPEQ